MITLPGDREGRDREGREPNQPILGSWFTTDELLFFFFFFFF